MKQRRQRDSAKLAVLTIIQGCKSDDIVSTPFDNLEVSTMIADGVTDASANTLLLDSVKILLKDIKLNVADSSDSTNFKTDPFVMYLNPNSTVNGISTALIPIGSYDKVQFEIHKLEDSEALGLDTAYSYNGGRYSVVVYGKYNGVAFIYRSTKSAKQKLSFSPPSVVRLLTRSDITLKVQR